MKYITMKTSYGEMIKCIPETEEEIQEFKDAKEDKAKNWCQDKEHQDDVLVDFYADGEHPDLYKHHYRCRHCKKIVQIG